MKEPSYFGLTNDHTWLSVSEKQYKKLKETHRMKCYRDTEDIEELETALSLLDVAITRYQNLPFSAESYVIQSCEYQLHDAQERARAILRKAQEQ